MTLYLPIISKVAAKFSAQLLELHIGFGDLPSAHFVIHRTVNLSKRRSELFRRPQRGAQQDRAWVRRVGERERGLTLEGVAVLGSGGLEGHGLQGEEMASQRTHFQGSRERPWKEHLRGWMLF